MPLDPLTAALNLLTVIAQTATGQKIIDALGNIIIDIITAVHKSKALPILAAAPATPSALDLPKVA
jgi:hypothetical protein